MITGLVFIIALLLVLVFNLIIQINKAEENHDLKIKQLQAVISQMVQEQNEQSLHLKLSEELLIKLQEARISLDENILELQYDLFFKVASKK